MKTQTIEVEGLPEGWKAVAYRVPVNGENFFYDGKICNDKNQRSEYLIVEKIQPHRIVLEEVIDQSDIKVYDHQINGIWFRKVKETDIPLTNDEHYLKLSKKDMLELIEHIKLGGQLNHKIAEFIKENS